MVSELEAAIAAQAADDATDYVKSDGHSIPTDPHKMKRFGGATPNLSKHISWGRPAQILEAKYDKTCPVCGRIQGPGYTRKDKSVQRGDFDIGFEGGKCYGARCLTLTCNGLQHYRPKRYSWYKCEICQKKMRSQSLLRACSCGGQMHRIGDIPDVLASDFSF